MINFIISAPGRIVLSGEHSAKYAKNFVVAGLDLRTNLEFSEQPDESRNIKIEFHNFNLQKDIPLEEFLRFFSDDFGNYPSLSIILLQLVNSFITSNCMCRTREQSFSLQLFFFLLFTIAYEEKLDIKPFRLRVSMDLIPMNAGFGSSTSFTVCLAACFLHWKRLQSGDHITFTNQELLLIERYTKSCKNIVQGYEFASIDAKICVYGRIEKCQRTFTTYNYNTYSTETINFITGMRILLIDSNIRQNKKERALQIAELPRSRQGSILNKLHKIATKICDDLKCINNTMGNPEAYNKLQMDILRNQQLLRTYNLSHQEFDRVCAIGNEFNLRGKLTGFEGGYVYFPIPPRITREEITHITERFLNEGFNYKITTINCDGVKIDD